jgi:hypothetical protein
MDEPGTDTPYRPAGTSLTSRSPWVTGFPGWTHLIATLGFAVWFISTTAYDYGIETGYGWWQGFGDLMPRLILAVLVLVVPPAVALEAWMVTRPKSRWAARVPVICYVLVAGFISFVPVGLRFGGDTSPTPVDTVMVSLATYAIVICAQVLCAYLVCRRWMRRINP